nr:hypothetical protein [Tanacetum cinerariifolium]
MEAPPLTVDRHHQETHRRTQIDLCGRVDIFDMVDIDLFTVVALNMMVLKLGYTGESELMFYNYLRPLTGLDVGLYALAYEEDVRCLATLVRSFKLIAVYIEHSVTVLDSYIKEQRFRETLEDIIDERAGSIAANTTEKMLLLTWHEYSETTKEPDYILSPPTDEFVITYTQLSGAHGVDTQSHVIDYVMRQLSFDETELDGEAGFVDVPGSGVDSSGLRHDESFGVDDLDLNLNEPVNLNVSQVKTQYELPVFEEPDVGPTQEHILAVVSTQEPIVAGVSTQEPIVAEVSTEAPIVEEVGTQEFSVEDVFFYDNEGIDTAYETEYDVQSSKDVGTDDDDDVDEDFLVDEENEIVEPDVDVHLFGISMDIHFDNIGITNLVPDDVLEGKDVDVINADGFDSDLVNDEEINYRKRRLAELRTKMEGVINASGRWKVNLDIPVKVVQDQLQRELEVQISMSKAFKAKAKAEREIRGDHVLQYSMLRDYRIYVCLGALKLGFRACRRDLLGLDGAFMKGPFLGQVLVAIGLDSKNGIYPLSYALVEAETKSSWFWFLQCLGDDIDLHPDSNFTFISDRQKDFEKCMLELNTMNPKAHEWLNKIPAEHWVRSYFLGRSKSNLLLNIICKVFNGKLVGGRDKPMITLLEYIREYFMKSIVNVQGSLGDQCVVDVVSMTCSCRKWELTGIPYKHAVTACWNMALSDRVAPPPETWVNPCYWLSTWNETYCHKIKPICKSNYWEKSSCPKTLLPPKHHVQVGRPKKKRKRSKHEDEPFVKDGKLSRKGRTITCQSCENIRHNKATDPQ